jgi:hypothetical protein
VIEIVEEKVQTDYIRSRNRVVDDVDDRQHDRVHERIEEPKQKR